jgi:hypothetical protein
MSFTLQFVGVCESDLIVQEHFIAFQDTAGQLLFILLNKLLVNSNYISRTAGASGMIMTGV